MEAKGYEEEDLHVIGTKLFDSVRDTLLKQGVLQRMKAELRTAVLTAIVGRRGDGPDSMPLYDQLSEAEDDQTRAIGTLTLFLVKDALEALNLPFTLSILIQEAGMDHVTMKREELAAHLGMRAPLDGQIFSDNRLGSIVSTLLAQRIFEPVTDELSEIARASRQGVQEDDDEYADDSHGGEYEEGDEGEYGGTMALSLADTTQKSLEGYINRVDIEHEVPDAQLALDQQSRAHAQQARLPPLTAAKCVDEVEDEEDGFEKNFDAADTKDDQDKVGFDSQVEQRVTISSDQQATKRIDLTQRLRLSKEDQLMLEQALDDDVRRDQDDTEYQFEPQAFGGSASITASSEADSVTKRGFVTPDEYKNTLSLNTGNQHQSNQQFEKDDVFSEVDESLEGSSPVTESHGLTELSASEGLRQNERAETDRRMQSSHSSQKQHEMEGFVDLAYQQHVKEEEDDDEALTGNIGEGQGPYREAGQESEQDEFQDLESVGQQDDLYDFGDGGNTEESGDFGTPSADKFDESPHNDQQDRQTDTDAAFREARDDILASQSADNYDEDFEVEEEDDVSAMSDFSAGGKSDREDSDF